MWHEKVIFYWVLDKSMEAAFKDLEMLIGIASMVAH